ncbi:MAG TPA: hypothetical protein DCM28_09480 [Phycisphaerales bacterium]|nr:hypothetical protein [Phycisphaerales bacterium]HCD34884.1 hypothetical protein [Phycisphaerales bacterium]|tara:strand:- start:7621 stop:8361 length:741 start_codon:yes stop_codon:yes gene_type:complete
MNDQANASKHVLISGGSRGLGQVLVQGMLDAGFTVTTFARKSSEFTDQLKDHPRFAFHIADMADIPSLQQVVKAGVKQFGNYFGLINCAGVAPDGVLPMMPEQKIDQVIDINLTGALKLTRLVLRTMLTSRSEGSIINISSIIGIRGYNGLAAYSASKGGMDAMSRALARELGERGIRVNSVAPGYLRTEMTHTLSEKHLDQIARRTPMGRLGTPEDVLGSVLFFLSDASRFVTGQTLVVDGGITT